MCIQKSHFTLSLCLSFRLLLCFGSFIIISPFLAPRKPIRRRSQVSYLYSSYICNPCKPLGTSNHLLGAVETPQTDIHRGLSPVPNRPHQAAIFVGPIELATILKTTLSKGPRPNNRLASIHEDYFKAYRSLGVKAIWMMSLENTGTNGRLFITLATLADTA